MPHLIGVAIGSFGATLALLGYVNHEIPVCAFGLALTFLGAGALALED